MKIIGKPWSERTRDSYPWRPLDNREKRARWALAFGLQTPMDRNQKRWKWLREEEE
jgi:hypothetical protein